MQVGSFRFDRLEFAGSLGDFGTLIPLSIALITINGLSFTTVFLMVGVFYVMAGLYYRLPIPVQPLKVVAAIAIASPEDVTLPVMAATGILFGAFMLSLAVTGAIDRISGLFSKPIVRGIQLGLGFILIRKGIDFIRAEDHLIGDSGGKLVAGNDPVNIVIGIAGIVLVLLLLNNRRLPAALALVGGGILIGIPLGAFDGADWGFGPTDIGWFTPAADDFVTAFYLLVLPQIPLTIGNAVIGTTDTAKTLFGDGVSTKRATNRAFSASMGLANIPVGFLGAMPMCHGAGGLAAHFRFGARTGGSNIMIGVLFLLMALALGEVGIVLLGSIPNAVLGVLLLFAGLELAVLIRDVQSKSDLFVACLIGGIGLATTNMAVAFGAGIAVYYFLKWVKVEV